MSSRKRKLKQKSGTKAKRAKLSYVESEEEEEEEQSASESSEVSESGSDSEEEAEYDSGAAKTDSESEFDFNEDSDLEHAAEERYDARPNKDGEFLEEYYDSEDCYNNEDIDNDLLTSMSVSKLRRNLRWRGFEIANNSKKAALKQQLKAFLEGKGHSLIDDDDEDLRDDAEFKSDDDFYELTSKQLKKNLDKRGLLLSGVKDELVNRLKRHLMAKTELGLGEFDFASPPDGKRECGTCGEWCLAAEDCDSGAVCPACSGSMVSLQSSDKQYQQECTKQLSSGMDSGHAADKDASSSEHASAVQDAGVECEKEVLAPM